jgi:hypothetical protein
VFRNEGTKCYELQGFRWVRLRGIVVHTAAARVIERFSISRSVAARGHSMWIERYDTVWSSKSFFRRHVVRKEERAKGTKTRYYLNEPKIIKVRANRVTSSDGVGLVGLIFQLGRVGVGAPIPRKKAPTRRVHFGATHRRNLREGNSLLHTGCRQY